MRVAEGIMYAFKTVAVFLLIYFAGTLIAYFTLPTLTFPFSIPPSSFITLTLSGIPAVVATTLTAWRIHRHINPWQQIVNKQGKQTWEMLDALRREIENAGINIDLAVDRVRSITSEFEDLAERQKQVITQPARKNS